MRVLFYEREGREYYQLPQWGRYECRSYTNEWMKLRKAILKRDEYTCYYCHQKGGKLEVDHKIPLCRGGNNDPDNLVAACRACNRQKHDKTDREYLDYRISKNAEAAP